MTRRTTGTEGYDTRGVTGGKNQGDYRVSYNVAKTDDNAPVHPEWRESGGTGLQERKRA